MLIPKPSTPRQHAQSAAETAREQHNDDKATACKGRNEFMELPRTLSLADPVFQRALTFGESPPVPVGSRLDLIRNQRGL
jgi:hypothetical protein